MITIAKRKKKTNEVDRELADYWEGLNEQIEFLVNGCKMFDQGNFTYAKQLATHIRVLVHDTSESTSLLKLIGRKDSMSFCSTASFPKKAVFHLGMVTPAQREIVNARGFKEIEHTFIPNLNENSGNNKKWVDFNTWYKQNVLISNPNTFSRKDMITYLANKDGGAHIDPFIETKYYKISKGLESMLYASPAPLGVDPHQKGTPYKNLHLSAVRQIAHELILSIRKEFGIRPNYNPSLKSITNGMSVNVQELIIAEGEMIEYER